MLLWFVWFGGWEVFFEMVNVGGGEDKGKFSGGFINLYNILVWVRKIFLVLGRGI